LCILKYQNPIIEKPEPQFFEATDERIIDPSLIVKRPYAPIILKSSTSRKSYIEKVNALKNHIKLGDIYEINFCIEFFAEKVNIDPITVFLNLYQLTKAPYSRLVKIHNDYIISASPELFLEKKENVLITKPIKGTIKRGRDIKEDEMLMSQLYYSVKERTENVMAVDVARNDLSIVAERGSVKVNKLYNIESFETVHQMVSTVSCELKPNIGFNEIINATFPMASMTGAPKIKAMELIDSFEDFKREFYSGSLGLVDESGNFQLSVLIRSIFYNSETKRLSLAVGSAITHLCDPETEYEECLLKAKALLAALDATIEP